MKSFRLYIPIASPLLLSTSFVILLTHNKNGEYSVPSMVVIPYSSFPFTSWKEFKFCGFTNKWKLIFFLSALSNQHFLSTNILLNWNTLMQNLTGCSDTKIVRTIAQFYHANCSQKAFAKRNLEVENASYKTKRTAQHDWINLTDSWSGDRAHTTVGIWLER